MGNNVDLIFTFPKVAKYFQNIFAHFIVFVMFTIHFYH